MFQHLEGGNGSERPPSSQTVEAPREEVLAIPARPVVAETNVQHQTGQQAISAGDVEILSVPVEQKIQDAGKSPRQVQVSLDQPRVGGGYRTAVGLVEPGGVLGLHETGSRT